MGIKPVPTARLKKWLKLRGLVYKRTEASHEIWDYPGDSLLRPVEKGDSRHTCTYELAHFGE
jgi:hypothetical protein